MDQLINLLVTTLQPAIEAIKNVAPEVIQKEIAWVVWSNIFSMKLGVAFTVIGFLLVVVTILGAVLDNWGMDHPVLGGFLGTIGTILLILGSAFWISSILTLKHLELNPTYEMFQHFSKFLLNK